MNAESKVGLLVLAFIAVLIFFTFKMGGDRLPWQDDDGYFVNILFDSISGLETKARVRYAGVDIGSVESIELLNGKANVKVKLKPEMQIREDAVFEIGSVGLMGEKYLMIHGGTSKSKWLADGDSVEGQVPVDMDKLISVLGDIGQDVKVITHSLREAIGETGDDNRLSKIMGNIDRLTESLANTTDQNKDDISQIIHNFEAISSDLKLLLRENQSNISNSLDNLDTVVASLADTVPEMTHDLKLILADLRVVVQNNKGNLGDTMQNVADASVDFKNTMNDFKGIIEKIDRGEGSIGKLIHEESFHDNLNTALKDIDKAAIEMRKFMGNSADTQLFLGYRGEYLSSSSEMKNYISVKLQPRPDKYYLLEIVSAPDGKYSERQYEIDFNSPPGTDFPDPFSFTVRDWDKSQLNFSVQFAKSFHDLTLRGGLIESTGGFGIDYNLLHDHLTISVDSWDFNREDDPHLKVGGRIHLGSSFYIAGGWDDFLSSEYDSLYFGAGFFIEDDDLKTLLGLMPFINGR